MKTSAGTIAGSRSAQHRSCAIFASELCPGDENRRFAAVALLTVDHLRTEFRGRNHTVTAVDDVSFTVDPGETVALVGESECGKSVTALSIMGLLPDESAVVAGGSVTFDGTELTSLGKRRLRAIRGTG